jgi:type I restriction-modification system DNA methylase subunit
MSRCALAGGTMEEEYLDTVKRYGKEDIKAFPEIFEQMVISMEEEKRDILGDYYMGAITYGEHGQFYTPENICDFMVKIVEPVSVEVVMDPCCGSGRMLLSAAKVNRRCTFYGQDLDFRCVEMCTINLALWGLSGFVTWGDSLKEEKRRVFRTGLPGTHGKGAIIEIDAEAHDFSSPEKAKETISKIKEAEQQGMF